jgi:hypothetical protein
LPLAAKHPDNDAAAIHYLAPGPLYVPCPKHAATSLQGFSNYEWPGYAIQATLAVMYMQRMDGLPPNECTSSEEWSTERDRGFEEYTVWSNAFRPLLLETKARESNDAHELRRANAIWMIYLTSYLG